MDLAGIAMGGHPSTAKYAAPSLVSKVPYAYCYRCPFGLDTRAAACTARAISSRISFSNTWVYRQDTSFMLVEAMQSDGGDVVPPKEYHEKLKRTCEKFGILYVADEVKMLPSRTGKLFGVENYGVIPDAVAMGKSIASGMPAGALVAREKLLDGGYLMSTLVGNSVVAAAESASQ